MSQITHWGQNILADYIRGQGLPLSSNLDLGLLSAFDGNSYTEVSWSGYSRVFLLRSGLVWSGTQGAGTTLPSFGTSHQTSNNAAIDFGYAVGSGDTVTHIGLFSDSNLFAAAKLPGGGMVVAPGDPITIPAGGLTWTLGLTWTPGLTGGLSDYFANKLIDLIWRGIGFVMPSSTHLRLMTTAPTNAGGGTEVSGAGYARIAIPSTMAAWSGTQGAGSTAASSGTSGRISNNADLVFADPGVAWGAVAAAAINDAASGGNLLFWAPLSAPSTITPGNPPPRFAADALYITFD